MEKTIYCIEFTGEFQDDNGVFHNTFTKTPDRDDIISFLKKEGVEFKEDYHKLEYYPVG